MTKFRLTPLVALISYLSLSLIMTWPLVTHLQGYVPGVGDWGQNMWALWWTRQALIVLGQNPFYTQTLFYPEGVTLLFHPIDLADGLLGIPLYGLLGSDITYNSLVLLSFVLSSYGTYLLALNLTHNRPASFIAGLIFSFSPYHFLRLELGHLNLATMQWLPFYILFTLKTISSQNQKPYRNPHTYFAIFFLAFTALHAWYYVIYIGLLTVAMIFYPTRNKLPHRFITITFILGTSLLILSPLIIPMMQLLSKTKLIGEHNPLRHSVDLVSFWFPGPPSTWATWFTSFWQPYAAQNREPGASAYLGYTTLMLSFIGLLSRSWRKPLLWWSTIALSFTLLALGPQLQIKGEIQPIYLPYALLIYLIPAFSLTGIPGRFIIVVSLTSAILAAFGLAKLATKLPPIHYIYFTICCSILILAEYASVPMHLTSTTLPDFYQQLAADFDSYAILDIRWDANFLMYAQTHHHKPLIGGWLARLPKEQAAYLEEDSFDKAFLRLILGAKGLQLVDHDEIHTSIQTALKAHNIRYIITHTPTVRPFLEQWVGWPIVYQSEEIVVYGTTPP